MEIKDADHARTILANARNLREQTRKQAGKAATDPLAVNRELTKATDFFSVEDWGNETLTAIAIAGGRIERIANRLRAADKLTKIDRIIGECEAIVDAVKHLPSAN